MPAAAPSPSSKTRLMRLLADELRKRFGVPPRSPRADILDALIETLLSQSTTDHNRDLAFSALKRRFGGWEEVAAARAGTLARVIRPAGLGNQKAGRILQFLRWLKRERGELSLEFLHQTPDAEAAALLTRHKGIGVKTAYVTLMKASSRDLFPVDVHIHRIARRLGLIGPRTTPEKAHGELGPLAPKGRAHELHMNLLAFGRTVCTARNPRCGECGLRRHCAFYRSTQGAG